VGLLCLFTCRAPTGPPLARYPGHSVPSVLLCVGAVVGLCDQKPAGLALLCQSNCSWGIVCMPHPGNTLSKGVELLPADPAVLLVAYHLQAIAACSLFEGLCPISACVCSVSGYLSGMFSLMSGICSWQVVAAAAGLWQDHHLLWRWCLTQLALRQQTSSSGMHAFVLCTCVFASWCDPVSCCCSCLHSASRHAVVSTCSIWCVVAVGAV
jgi:hypothetical protein